MFKINEPEVGASYKNTFKNSFEPPITVIVEDVKDGYVKYKWTDVNGGSSCEIRLFNRIYCKVSDER